MTRQTGVSVLSLLACAGAAVAQPTIDGVFDAATEASVYGGIRWTNPNPTSFGDNSAGRFNGGVFGDPQNVTRGVELRIPLASLGLTGTSTFRLTGWVNSGDRSFMSNQTIAGPRIDSTNFGNPPTDFSNATDFPGGGDVTVNLASAPVGTPTLDGNLDGGTAGTQYSRVFLQTNFTGFGNETDGTIDGSGPNGGGSEIDAVYVARDATNLYLFIAGNLEANGNAIDLYFDTQSGGESVLSGASFGSGGFIPNAQTGNTFDTGFGADFVASVAIFNGTDVAGYLGTVGGEVFFLGQATGFGAANALAGGDAAAPTGVAIAVDNSNIAGVLGSPGNPTPVSPDADWAYGSELNNVRAGISGGRLNIFVGGNAEVNFNKIVFFIDSVAGEGQNILRTDNVDISFGGLNRQGGLIFDEGFAADYWFNVNNGVDGGNGNLINFADAATLRTNGPDLDLFSLLPLDAGCFFGGGITDGSGNDLPGARQLIDFSGPRLDIQDGFTTSLFSEFAPQTARDAQGGGSATAGRLQVAINNSNVGGVTSDSADPAAVNAVSTGFEISIDLAELRWNGTDPILLTGWVASGDFGFVSNQVIAADAVGTDNLGTTSAINFTLIPGEQYIDLTADEACPADFNGDTVPGDIFDLFDFLAALDNGLDFNGDTSPADIFDLFDFLAVLDAGCP